MEINVSCTYIFASCESPDVQVIDAMNTWNLKNLFLDNITVNSFWLLLHKYAKAVFEDRYSGEHNEDWEDIGADWIGNFSLWPEVDEDWGNNNTNWLEHITNHVNNSGSDIDVFFVTVWVSSAASIFVLVIMVFQNYIMMVVFVIVSVVMFVIVAVSTAFVSVIVRVRSWFFINS